MNTAEKLEKTKMENTIPTKQRSIRNRGKKQY